MMASKEGEGLEPLQKKTWVLKVSIHCEGCKKKVNRILQNIHGVSTIEIDSKQNKVTVTGDVEAETLIKKLLKSGKHAELLPIERKPNNPNPNTNSNKTVGKGKKEEKDDSKSNESAEKLAPANSEPKKKPSESDEKHDGESSQSSSKEPSEPDPKPETQTKPTDTAPKSKKKGKKTAEEATSNNEQWFVLNSGGVQTRNQVPMYPQPVPMYPQPVYATTSYNMMHPTTSYSYYTQMPDMPQSYVYSSQQSSDYNPNHAREDYYGSVTSSLEENKGSYDFFSEENANACDVM